MKKNSYTVKEKLDTLKKLEENNFNVSKTAREVGVSNKMVRDWRNNKEKLVLQKDQKTRKKVGSGAKPSWPQIEDKLKTWIFLQRRRNKRIISFCGMREKALKIAADLNISDFVGSTGWLTRFMTRNGFSCRKITSIGQEDNRSPIEIKKIIEEYLENLKNKIIDLNEEEEIYNMDETPVYIDMMQTRTISFKGEKNTEAYSTGNQKTRITVVLTISSSGKMHKGMIILKGLKKPPKCTVPSNLIVCVSSSGTMDKSLMITWIKSCLNKSGPFKDSEKKVLLLDSFKSHHNNDVLDCFSEYKVETVLIPPRTTSFLQPLDVLINSSFKAHLKQQWQEWMLNGPQEFTKNGYRRRPSWEYIFSWISKSIEAIKIDTILKAFDLCACSKNIELNANTADLNEKLKTFLELKGNENVYFEIESIDDSSETYFCFD